MKLLALFMGILLSLQLTVCPIANAAADMSMTSTGGVQGHLPVNKIGALLLPDGIAIMNGDNIQVQGKDQDGKSQTQLSGTVFKVSQAGNTISGFAYFNDGPGMATLALLTCPEDVVLTDGSKVDGSISSVTSDAVTIGGRSIPMSQVQKIHSPRIFNFKMNGENAKRVSFEPTCLHAVAVNTAKTKNTSDSRMHRTASWCKRHPYYTTAIVIGVGCAIACAIALPIAIPLAQHHGGGSSGGSGSSSGSGNGQVVVINGFPFLNGKPLPSGN